MENKVMNVKFTRKKEEGEIFDFQKKDTPEKKLIIMKISIKK